MKRLITVLFLIGALQCLRAQNAPDFSFTDINGELHQLQHALDQGFIVMLDFFYAACLPCQQSSPEIENINQDYAGKNLTIWSISDRDDNEAIQAFKDEFGLTNIAGGILGGGFQLIHGTFATQFTLTGFPTISVICPDGAIHWDIWPYSPGAPEWRDAIEACGVSDAEPYQSLTTAAPDLSYLVAEATLGPNPAKEQTRLAFDLTEKTPLSIDLYDNQGQLVRQVFRGALNTGAHQYDIELSDLPAGMYRLRLSSRGHIIRTLNIVH